MLLTRFDIYRLSLCLFLSLCLTPPPQKSDMVSFTLLRRKKKMVLNTLLLYFCERTRKPPLEGLKVYVIMLNKDKFEDNCAEVMGSLQLSLLVVD